MDSGNIVKRPTRREILQATGTLAGGWALSHVFPLALWGATPRFMQQGSTAAGDAFTFAASTQHTFRATPQAGRTQVLWVVSPALPDAPLYTQPPASTPSRRLLG